MDNFTTDPHTTPGVYGSPIPWHMRRNNPTHRPFAAFASSKPTPPPRYAFSTPREELDEQRSEALFRERQRQLARMPGAPLERRHRPSSRKNKKDALADKGPRWVVEKWRGSVNAISGAARDTRTRVVGLGQAAQAKYRELAFAWERWYWLHLTAYRQSAWPSILRLVRNLVLLLLALALVLWIGKLKLEEMRSNRVETYYVLVPNYRSWSVSKPRYAGACEKAD